jgi:hypothetical protein
MNKNKYDSEIEFNRLMTRNKHLEKMVSRYKPPEEWENLKEGDAVIIDNRDSLHDGMRGKFLAHDWAIAGYVRLVVAFPDGKHCYYLPTQVVKVYEEEQIEPTPAPVPEPPPESEPSFASEPKPEPEKKRIEFRVANPEKWLEENERTIEAKLEQIAKMPKSVRKQVLSSTLNAGLVPRALKLAKQRGILPA